MSSDRTSVGSRPEDQLSITRAASDDTTLVLVLEGELDPFTAPLFMAEIEGSLGDEVVNLQLDMGGVSFLDSSGLRVLMAAHNKLKPRGGGVVLAGATDIARRVIEIAGLDRSFTLLP